MKLHSLSSKAIIPIETHSTEAAEQLQVALANMEQLRNNLGHLRSGGFTLLPESRRLKVQPIHRERDNDPYYVVPSLQLCGSWLQKTGFESNQHARIITLHQLLVICPEEILPVSGKLIAAG